MITQEARNLIGLYEMEDQVFRLAAFLREKENGATDAEAGRAARRSFLDYEINAPWVSGMRRTFLPFISFTYRAVPMLLSVARHKPWKIAKLAAAAGVLNALAYAALGADGDEDDERRLLPEEKAGKMFMGVPKLARMPWNDPHGSPVFLDIRRFIPVGDVFDVGQTHSAIPILPPMVAGGPLELLGEFLLNKSAFTGKEITLESDTLAEKASKSLDYLYKAFAPNFPGLPGTYSTSAIMNAASGKTDAFGRELSTAQAMASSVGVKLGAYPKDVLLRNLKFERDSTLREIGMEVARIRREYDRHGIDRAEFEARMNRQVEKRKLANLEFIRRVNG